jgi:predicted PurR-regulated permease PerM
MLFQQVMSVWLKFWSGLSSRLLVLPLALMFTLSLTGCGTSPLSLLTGGGTQVAANTQVGKQNNQTLGSSTVQEFGETTVQAEKVTNTQNQTTRVSANDVQTVVVNEVPTWIILLLVVGWLLPSPNEMARWIRNLFSRKKDNG